MVRTGTPLESNSPAASYATFMSSSVKWANKCSPFLCCVTSQSSLTSLSTHFYCLRGFNEARALSVLALNLEQSKVLFGSSLILIPVPFL